MVMSLGLALLIIVALASIPWAGMAWFDLGYVFGVMVPYAALSVFLAGGIHRLITWGGAPDPFKIPTTAGQQKSLNWIEHDRLENPYTVSQVMVRMAAEVLLFRSLFRNRKTRSREGPRLTYASSKWLWMFAMAFHYALLTTVFGHLRFFVDPVPSPVQAFLSLDAWFSIGLPRLMISGLVLLGAVSLLLARRIFIPNLRYISLLNDYFPLVLIGAIALSGAAMRYITGVDVAGVKTLAMGLVSFRPVVPENLSALFFVHIFLVSALLAYLPFSKLMHMAGIFFCPTRNQPNNSRAVRHVNPWNYVVDYHTYEAYEDEFRDKMMEAGIPLEKSPQASPGEDKESDKQSP
jgi:nitrate reductase gamma subunit